VVVAALWLGGVLVWAICYSRQLRRYRQIIGSACPVPTSGHLLTLLTTWRSRLRIRRQVRLVTSPARVSPFTTGCLRPLIFIPQALLRDGNPELIEAILAHELVHVARWDSFWQRLQHLIQGLYFFHPLVWITGARLHHERERICDTTVLSFGTMTGKAYAGSILDVMQLRLQGVGVPALSTQKRRAFMRLRSIIEHRPGRPHGWLAAAMVVAIGLFLLPLAGTEAGSDDGSAATRQAVVAEVSDPETATEQPTLNNPLPGARVSLTFGPALDPWTHKKMKHRGIDLAHDLGTPIVAPADGVVEVATESYQPSPGSGTVIIIDHGGGLKTLYSHLHSLAVAEGDEVKRGDKIAEVGSTGRSTGPHLHLEVLRNGTNINPADVIDFSSDN
jgi:murein DD-endopeptidase MepM/ murein hydrolase activator NlpD